MAAEVTSDGLQHLVERATTADPDAWEALYRRAYPRLFAFARRRLPSDEQADDVVSEAFSRAITKVHTFTWTGNGSFDGWMYGITRNVVREAHRGVARVDAQHLDGLPAPEHRGLGPAEQLLVAEEHDALRAAFGRLDEEERDLLELRVVAGLGADTVGEVLGKGAGAVRMAQSRALGRLRTMLQEELR